MTLETIEKTQSILLSDIEKYYKKKELDKVISLIDTYAYVTQLINNELYNDKIENIIEGLSNDLKISPSCEKREDNVIVFYDQIGSTICLSEQYIDGIIELGYRLVYIYENPYCSISHSLLSKLSKCNIEIHCFNTSSCENQSLLARKIFSIIDGSGCNKLLVQSPAYGSLCSVVLSSLQNIKRYRVVPGDHHFYIGVKCTDYFFEFRPYGITRAVRERNINPDQIIKLPYYPIVNLECDFKGFPVETEGKTVIVTAGDTYKFWGSDVFYVICEQLAQIDNVIILFIGRYNKKLETLCKQKGLDNKIVQIGYRKDFSKCIQHCDMLLSSYPMIGGLISQMAASLGKPIIAFAEKTEIDNGRSFEDILGNNCGERLISRSSVECLMDYARGLINVREFRTKEGNYIRSLVQTKERFNLVLGSAFLNPKSNLTNGDYVNFIDKSSSVQKYIDVQNSMAPSFIMPLIREFGPVFLVKFKHHFIDCLKSPVMASKYFISSLLMSMKMKYKTSKIL